MATLKYSRQRESIKEFLANRYDHPTADVVYENIKQIYPNISLGTVYRNLGLLTELGEVQKITTGDGKDHYDGNTEPHYHFICQDCGSLIDLEMESIDMVQDVASKNFDGQINGYSVLFYGVCGKCTKKS